MRKILIFIALLVATGNINSQTTLPALVLKTSRGVEVNLCQLTGENKPVIIIFWATWCTPCIEELENISDLIPDWRQEVDFTLIAINVDDSRSSSAVHSFISGKQWDFKVLLDQNQDAMRAMNVTVIPHYFIYNDKGLLKKRHNGYLPGDEDIMFEELKAVADDR